MNTLKISMYKENLIGNNVLKFHTHAINLFGVIAQTLILGHSRNNNQKLK